MEAVREHLERGRYLDSRHAHLRQSERNISRPELLYVLRTGFHEKKRDRFDEVYQAWNYAVRGKTVDKRDLRVIVTFDESGMLIITAIEIER
jgi:hypothetical protein